MANYNALDKKTWATGEPRQPLPTHALQWLPAEKIETGDAIFDPLVGVWRGVIRITWSRDQEGNREIIFHFEDGGLLNEVSPDDEFFVDEEGNLGWSSPEASQAFQKEPS